MTLVEQRQEWITAIEDFRPLMVRGLVQEMYRDPFWEARYGERGRTHTVKDTHYHLNKLIDAIALDLPDIFTQYYHWVQELLVYRGMCTLHLEETLDSLARQLAHYVPEYWQQIQVYLKAGYAGLFYDQPNSQALQQQSVEIARSATTRLFDSLSKSSSQTARGQEVWFRDNRFYLSYLADAVWVEKEELFRNHMNWVKTFLAQNGVEEKTLSEDLHLLAEETERALPGSIGAPFVRLLQNQAKG